MVGLGYALQATLGTSTVVDGLACTPNSPAAMNVLVAPGSIYSVDETDATAYGSLAIDTTNIVKQGIVGTTTTLSCPAPATTGQSVVYLVQVAYQDVDAGSTVLPYYNAADPSVAWSGPSNSGTSQNTVRKGVCTVAVKTGVAATTGTQTTPAADAGYTGLYAITVANGATSVTSGNIQTLSTAPFITTKLPQVPTAIQQGTPLFAHDTSGAANTITVALSPIPAALTDGQVVRVKIANSSTGATVMNVNGLGNVSCVTTSGAAFTTNTVVANGIYTFAYDANGTRWQLQSATSVDASSLTGTTLASNVVTCSLATFNNSAGFAFNPIGAGFVINSAVNTAVAYSINQNTVQNWHFGMAANSNVLGFDPSNGNISAPVFAFDVSGNVTAGLWGGSAIAPASSFRALTANWASNATATIAFGSIVVTGTNISHHVPSNSLTLNSATSGANGLDTGSIANSTWYFIYVIYNPTTSTTACLMSLSATAPTLPSGYTLKSSAIGAVRTDSSGHFLGFTQDGRWWQYQVGNNLSALPSLISGATGSLSTPTYTSVSVSSLVPSTASKIGLTFSASTTTNNGGIYAPNANYGAVGSTTNPPLLFCQPNTGGSSGGSGIMNLESTNVYAAQQANAYSFVNGFEINI